MLRAIKIRLYPNKSQEELLAKAFGCVRWLHNEQMAETQRVYSSTGKGLSQFDMNKRIPSLKVKYPWLSEAPSQSLQAVSLNLSRAFKNFFSKRARYPRFKSKGEKQSIQYPQGVRVVDNRKVFLPKIGHVKAVVHRPIDGTIKTCTVTKTTTGKYFVSVLADDGLVEPTVSYEGEVLGIDMGLNHLLVDSDGVKVENPRHMRKAEANLRRKQRALSRKQKGSSNREKARKKVARCHERVANCRLDTLHKLSRRVVDESQVIAAESLNVMGMLKNRKLAKGISDASWGTFLDMVGYKAKHVGKAMVEVGRFFPSSKTCNACGEVYKGLGLSDRVWACGSCGAEHDRDTNAARNIRDEACKILAVGRAATAYGGDVRPVNGGILTQFGAIAVEVGSPCL